MKKTLAILLVLILSISLFAGCGGSGGGNNATSEPALSGKYTLTSMLDDEGNDWIELLLMMSEMGDEGEVFDLESFFIDFPGGDKCVFSVIGEEPMEGTFKLEGDSVEITIDGESIEGTIEDNKIILEDDGLKMVFEKQG